MAAITSLVIGAIGLGIAGAGTYMQYQGQKKQAEAQEKAIGEQQKAEKARQQQLNLDAMRRKREIIRQSLAARAQALATVTAQGASGQGGSQMGGATGSISGRTNVNMLGVSQNQELGNNIFAANQGMLSAYRQSAQAGAGVAMGAGLSSLGGALMKNNETIARIGTSVGGYIGRLA
jgi:uncharacterized membrane protein